MKQPQELEEEHEEEEFNEDIKEDVSTDTEEKKPIQKKEIKKEKSKRQLTEKQLEALQRGRQKGLEKLKEKGQITKQKKEIKKQILENDVKDIEEMKKVAEFSTIDKKVDTLFNRFNDIDSKITEIVEMKKKKQSVKYQNALKENIKIEAKQQVLNDRAKVYNRWDFL